MIRDREEIPVSSHGQHWMTAWHPPNQEPGGKRHGSAGLCFTRDGRLVLISSDGATWDLPAGRPEGDESWEQTLRREVLEEACVRVTQARLLGFSRGRCVSGSELGLVLVRSIWRAEVELLDWKPQFEISHRKVIEVSEARSHLSPAVWPVWERALAEAMRGRTSEG